MRIMLMCLRLLEVIISYPGWTPMFREVGVEPLAVARRHAEMTRGIANHAQGPPHPQIWRALLHSMSELCIKNLDEKKPPNGDEL